MAYCTLYNISFPPVLTERSQKINKLTQTISKSTDTLQVWGFFVYFFFVCVTH